jgi:hypothetical protein
MVSADADATDIAVTDITTEANKELRKNLTPYSLYCGESACRITTDPTPLPQPTMNLLHDRYHNLCCRFGHGSIQN